VAWDPQLYLKFDRERTQPAIDLTARIEISKPRRIIDLGCGPGNSTAVLHKCWPKAELTGLDADEEMLLVARQSCPTFHWLQGDAAAWQASGKYDVVFSNALLQWLPDHAETIKNWYSAVAPGGALAVQIPVNFNSPVHQHILEVADDPRWKDTIGPARGALYAKEPAEYYDIIAPLTSRFDLWVTEYCHVLTGPERILDWMRGTGLRPFLSALPSDTERKLFEGEFLTRVTASYPRQTDDNVIFPFRRLFFIAYRQDQVF
jgi:trans-aconitate 2-methyltransferase